MILLYDQYFLYKPSFPSSQRSKTLEIRSTISKSTGGTTYSSFRPPGTPFRPDFPPKIVFFDLCWLFRLLYAVCDLILSHLK